MFTEILEKIIFGFILCCINLWLLSLFMEGCNSNFYSILPCILNSTYSNYTYICCFWLLVDLVLIYGQFCLVILHLLSMPMAAVFYCPCLRELFFIVQSVLPCTTSSAFSINSCYLWLCIFIYLYISPILSTNRQPCAGFYHSCEGIHAWTIVQISW